MFSKNDLHKFNLLLFHCVQDPTLREINICVYC